jgi:hypothetical protein
VLRRRAFIVAGSRGIDMAGCLVAMRRDELISVGRPVR